MANVFYDPDRKKVYRYSDKAITSDGSWYGGTPLWVLAEKAGMRTASMFWPGSEADIQGVRLSYYYPEVRRQVSQREARRTGSGLASFACLEASALHRSVFQRYRPRRPRLADPDSPQVADAVHEVDSNELGALCCGNQESLGKLPVDVVVVSDHGMATIQGGWINLEYQVGLDVSLLQEIQGFASSIRNRSRRPGRRSFILSKARATSFAFTAGRTFLMILHFSTNPREGDPVVVAHWSLCAFAPFADPAKPKRRRWRNMDSMRRADTPR